MRRGSIPALALVGLLGLLGSTVSAQPSSPYASSGSGAQLDSGLFYDDLAPYGDWVEMQDYGWCWAPRVDYDWRPYTIGQWAWTDEDGWYWDSDERWGWATYHYGRWVDDPYYGWLWVPGNEWGPSWVSWRHGNGYIGWAPLPPRARWAAGIGLRVGAFEIDAFLPVRDYNFVPERAIGERGVYRHLLPPAQNATIVNVTSNATDYAVVNQRAFNRGPAPELIERDTGQRIPRVQVRQADRPQDAVRVGDGEIAVFRADVKPAVGKRQPPRGRSLVGGDAPPPQLAARKQQRERDRLDTAQQQLAVPVTEAEKPSGRPQREQARQKDAEAQQHTPQPGNAAPGVGGLPAAQTRGQRQDEQQQQQQHDQNKQVQERAQQQQQQQHDQNQQVLERAQRQQQQQHDQNQQVLERAQQQQQQQHDQNTQVQERAQQQQQQQHDQNKQQQDRPGAQGQQQKKDEAKAAATPSPKKKEEKDNPDDRKP